MSAIAPVALETLPTERFSDGVEHNDTDDALPQTALPKLTVHASRA